MRLDGKVAVITGAASGFGEGMAKRFAAEGAKIMVADINDNGSARVVGEIAAASNEQAQGISQVNEGLMQLDIVTQQNTASAEESASAAVELSGQASQLQDILKQFKIKETTDVRGLPSGMTPEMNAIFAQYLESQGQATANLLEVPSSMGHQNHTQSSVPKVLLESAHSDPNDIIPMDDADMGRY